MPSIERCVEAVILQAIRRGAFDNLPGKGKPLNLQDNPFVDKEWQLAFNMLEQRGFALPWIEKREEIESSLQVAKETLTRTWVWRNDAREKGEPAAVIEDEWRRAEGRFRETVEILNKLIADYNLEVPADVFFRKKIDLEEELHLVESGGEAPHAEKLAKPTCL